MDLSTIANKIIEGLGGTSNINHIEYCMTRLRVDVVDSKKVNFDEIKGIEGVLGSTTKGGDIQIILGPGTAQEIAQALNEIPELNMEIIDEEEAGDEDSGGKPKKLAVSMLSQIFTPLIPALIGSGLVAGFAKFLQSLGVSMDLGFMQALNAIGFAFFGYIIIMVAMNTAKVFGGSPILGAVAGSILITPAIGNLGLTPGRGGVIGAMLAGILMALVERYLRKISPNAIKVHFPPTFAVLISGFLILYVLQPVAGFLADGLVNAVLSLLDVGGALAGAAISFLFLPLVMTGLHHGLTPIHLELINEIGYTQLQVMNSMAGAGQVGAGIALLLRYRSNLGLKNTIKGALPVGILGIGEPLIFGVTLPLGRPFITACLGAAIGGAFVGAVGLGATGVYVSGILGIAIATNPLHYVIAYTLAAVAGFVLTYMVAVPKNLLDSLEASSKSSMKA